MDHMPAEPFDHFADLDYERRERCGFPEVIYASGKEPEQVRAIAERLLQASAVVLATRVDEACARTVQQSIPDAVWAPRAHLLFVDRRAAGGDPLGIPINALRTRVTDIAPLLSGGVGNVTVCCAGTSDLPVAEEAALTARLMGSHVELICDIGVAGVHRVLERTDDLRQARALVVVAGMEGALPSMVAGLVDVPVFAVPTSVGYGANLGGVTALLGMLCSCAGGVSVVNIDNGFGAGQCADRVNRTPARFLEAAEKEDGR